MNRVLVLGIFVFLTGFCAQAAGPYPDPLPPPTPFPKPGAGPDGSPTCPLPGSGGSYGPGYAAYPYPGGKVMVLTTDFHFSDGWLNPVWEETRSTYTLGVLVDLATCSRITYAAAYNWRHEYNYGSQQNGYSEQPVPLNINTPTDYYSNHYFGDQPNGESLLATGYFGNCGNTWPRLPKSPPYEMCKTNSFGYSSIDNLRWAYLHDAADYRTGSHSGSCASCGGGTSRNGIGALPQLELVRFHRYERIGLHSSFGPGVFSNFDSSISLAPGVIEFHDVTKSTPIDLTDPNGDGLYTDETWRAIRQLRMLDGSNAQTSVMANARTAELTTHEGSVYTFEIFRLEPAGTVNFHGRLLSIKDRNGNGYTLTYVNTDAQATDAALNGDRQGLWRFANVTDAYGKQMSFTWTRANGQWCISQATLPNTQNILYSYATGSLSSLNGITYPDGSVSMFDTQFSASTGLQKVLFDDAGAEDVHRRKSVYFTPSIYTHPIIGYNLTLPQASNLVRQVENGAGELSYKNWITWSGSTCNIYYYEGGGTNQNGGKLHWLDTDDGLPRKKYVAKTFDLANPISSYTWELQEEYTLDAQRRLTSNKNGLGRTDFVLDPTTGAVLQENRYKADNSLFATESTTYNSFKEPLLHTDRLGRVTKYDYDAKGNMLKKYAAFGTADQSIWEWTFNTKGQPLTSKDANLNVTDYVYNAAGFLTTVTEPADVTGGARASRTFTYDTAGRLDTATEPAGDSATRTVTYGYDTRSRITSITYHDSSVETFVYGNGAGASGNANLLIQQVDRNGRNTVFEYDLTGRKTRSYVVGTGNPPTEDEKVFAYLPGCNVVSQSTDRGETTTRTFDYLRRPKTVVVKPNTATTLTTTMTYDSDGRLILEQDPWNRRTFYAYDFEDRLNRTVRETVPGGIWGTSDPIAMVRDFGYNAALAVEDTEYDVEGQVLKRIDPRGIVDTFAYDFQGRLKSTVKAAAKRDAANVETAITNMKIAARTDYTYDAQGNTLSVKHPRSFDTAEAANFITQSTYTNRNLLKTRTEAFGRTEAATQSFTYTLERKLSDVTDGRGKVWSQIWKQCCGRLAAKVDPLLTDNTRPLTFYNYDAVGNMTHTVVLRDIAGLPSCCNPDPLDADTLSEVTTRYDVLNRPIAQTRWLVALGQVNENNPPIAGLDGVPTANGMTTRWVYDDNLTDGIGLDATYAAKLTGLNLGAGCDGSAVEVTSPTGEKSLSILDGLGRSIRTVDASGNATTTAYDVLNTQAYNVNMNAPLMTTTVTDPLNNIVYNYADALGRVIWVLGQPSVQNSYRYDIAGNMIYSRDRFSSGVDNLFDERNRMTQSTDTAVPPSVTKTEYDAHGNVIKSIDALNKNTVYVYDARDRKKTVTDRVLAATNFQYDANNNLTQITDAQTGVTTYGYDARNLLSDETFPGHSLPSNNEQRLYTYDPAKRLKTRTDQTPTVSTNLYDLAGRLTQRSYPDNLNDVFTYDLAGRVLTANSLRYSNLITRTYDTSGRLNTETQRVGAVDYVVGYGYDAMNRQANVTYPNGKIVNRTWTPHGRLLEVKYDGVSERIYSYTYPLPASLVNGNSWGMTFQYYTDNTIKRRNGPFAGGDETYTYDANKRKTGVTNPTIPSNNRTYSYDDEDRLTGFTRSNGDAQSWNLSLVGDWNTFTKNGSPETRTHNSVHEVTQVAATALTYDLKGNLLTNNNGQTYTWDIENRLKTATSTGLNASYAYDALGRRVSKTVNGFTTVFISDGLREICEYDNGAVPASPTRLYVFDEYIDEPVMLLTGGQKYYYGVDSQSSVMGITNNLANYTEKYKYDPYGKVTILAPDGVTVRATSIIGNEITYTGRRRDAETGLYYFRNRYYSGDLGRFVSRDPLRYVDGMSLYAGYYVPNGTDPLGLCKEISVVVLDYDKYRDHANETQNSELVWKVKQFRDVVNAVAEAVSSQSGNECCVCVKSLTFLGHGNEGDMSVGAGQGGKEKGGFNIWTEEGRPDDDQSITNENIAMVEKLKSYLCTDALITLRGCFTANGARGEKFLREFAERTNAWVTGYTGKVYSWGPFSWGGPFNGEWLTKNPKGKWVPKYPFPIDAPIVRPPGDPYIMPPYSGPGD